MEKIFFNEEKSFIGSATVLWDTIQHHTGLIDLNEKGYKGESQIFYRERQIKIIIHALVSGFPAVKSRQTVQQTTLLMSAFLNA